MSNRYTLVAQQWLDEAIERLGSRATDSEITAFVLCQHREEIQQDDVLLGMFDPPAAIERRLARRLSAGEITAEDNQRGEEGVFFARHLDRVDAVREELDRLASADKLPPRH